MSHLSALLLLQLILFLPFLHVCFIQFVHGIEATLHLIVMLGHLFPFVFFFLLHHVACWSFDPPPGIKPLPPAAESSEF